MSKNKYPKISKTNNYLISFSTKEDGNMLRVSKNHVQVHKNRLLFLKKTKININNLFIIHSSHSPNIEVINSKNNTYLKETYKQYPILETDLDHYYTGADGAITFSPKLSIGLISGDCVPLIIWDNISGMHGILHIGLLGTLNNMVQILPQIFKRYNVKLKNVNFYIGPSITQKNYNINNSSMWSLVANQVRNKIPDINEYIKIKNKIEYFNMQKMIIDQLSSFGIKKAQIQQYEFCIGDKNSIFFSHHILKQTGEKGNFLSIIGKK